MDETERLTNLDHRHLWHPFTPMAQWRRDEPLIIERGDGFILTDTRGRHYIDGVSSLWCNVHGHRAPQIDQAIRRQLDQIGHSTLLGLASPPSIELAARLCQIAPGQLNKVFYSDAGAAAVEVALKLATAYWHYRGKPDKHRFIALKGAYHGDTTGAMSVGFSEPFHHPFVSMTFPTRFFAAPDACRPPASLAPLLAGPANDVWPSKNARLAKALCDYCLDQLRELLREQADQTAAVIIEPMVQGAAGMICQPAGFIRGVANLAAKHDVLLIADEVATGFGRTGQMFACDHEKVEPDILCLGKGISGGYLPLAATLVTDEVEHVFSADTSQRHTFYHGHTYTGNALGCAAGLASLELFESKNLLEHIRKGARIITDHLNELRRCNQVLDVRQCGLMVGIELCRDRTAPEPFDGTVGAAVCNAMRPKGLILRPLGDVLVLMPAPAMPHDTLESMLDIVIETICQIDTRGHITGPTWQPSDGCATPRSYH